MEELIYINERSLSPELCAEIINVFETNDLCNMIKTSGCVVGGVNSLVKDTIDVCLPNNSTDTSVNNIVDVLTNELNRNIHKYIEFLKNYNINIERNTFFLQYETFQIQKYMKNIGKFTYHEDSHIEYNEYRYRVFTYLWYLNDVDEGGETEFLNNRIKVKPNAGKLILFPACWTFPHKGHVPVSNDKYIVTGWVFINENKYLKERLHEVVANGEDSSI
jgi:Rps23 Pro-64 3,4-dihydroxylase Tpa1-like proline 4-hydroxylase